MIVIFEGNVTCCSIIFMLLKNDNTCSCAYSLCLFNRLDGETSVNSGLTKKTELLKQNLKEAEEKNKSLIIDINDLKSR